MIKDSMEEAVNQCLQAAQHQYQPQAQKMLLRVCPRLYRFAPHIILLTFTCQVNPVRCECCASNSFTPQRNWNQPRMRNQALILCHYLSHAWRIITKWCISTMLIFVKVRTFLFPPHKHVFIFPLSLRLHCSARVLSPRWILSPARRLFSHWESWMLCGIIAWVSQGSSYGPVVVCLSSHCLDFVQLQLEG